MIEKIKAKRELSDLPDSIVKETLLKVLKRHNLSEIPDNKRAQKDIIKEVRAELRNYTGRFQKNSKNRQKLLENNQISELLKTHTSTKERLDIYEDVIELIKKHNPQSILDLGSGINPIAVVSELKNVKYISYDIKEDEVDLINEFFGKKNLNGKAEVKDIRKIDEFPKTDLTLIFKTLDILDIKGHKYSHRIMSKMNSKIIIVSFSTKTLSGRKMSSVRRKWFESLLEGLNYSYKIEIFPGEIFYIIETRQPR